MKLTVAVAIVVASAAAAWSAPASAQGYYVQPNGYYYPNQYQYPVANPGYVSTYPNYGYGQPVQNGAVPQFTVPGSATAVAPIGPPVGSTVPLGQQTNIQQPANAMRQDTSQQAVRPPGAGSAGTAASTTQKDPRGMAIEGTARVIDGDTFMVDQQMVTLYGADAPEMDQLCHSQVTSWRCGARAKEELAKLVEGRLVSCVGQRQAGDAIAAQCSVPTGDVAEQMVRSGFAVVPWELVKTYLPAQEMAKGAGRGVWAGEFEWPWEFRSRSQMVKLTR
ncbi:endonuclease YncB(thermonuclease family) [Bradyrhizobium sp. USDA 4341]